uniref:Uncharacterized protein n=1 Tax=Romanomermis culicivorax TaxID=13658 RepID=A0A915HHK7_ROMCU
MDDYGYNRKEQAQLWLKPWHKIFTVSGYVSQKFRKRQSRHSEMTVATPNHLAVATPKQLEEPLQRCTLRAQLLYPKSKPNENFEGRIAAKFIFKIMVGLLTMTDKYLLYDTPSSMITLVVSFRPAKIRISISTIPMHCSEDSMMAGKNDSSSFHLFSYFIKNFCCGRSEQGFPVFLQAILSVTVDSRTNSSTIINEFIKEPALGSDMNVSDKYLSSKIDSVDSTTS